MAKTINPASNLLNALKFISVTGTKTGNKTNKFCSISHNLAVMSNDTMTVGHPIEEDLSASPDVFKLIEALGKVKSEFAITQLGPDSIAVSSNTYRAVVECDDDPGNDYESNPDDPCAIASNEIKAALLLASSAVETKLKKGDHHLFKAHVLLKANIAVGSNGKLLIEYWHGVDLPDGIMIPENVATAVGKCKYNLTDLGFRFENGIPTSITFHFGNKAFIKTKLIKINMPDYEKLFDVKNLELNEIPDNFFPAIKTVKSFSKENAIIFKKDTVGAYDLTTNTITSSCEIDLNVHDEMVFDSKLILPFEKHFNKMFFIPKNSMLLFFGQKTRGAVIGFDVKQDEQEECPF